MNIRTAVLCAAVCCAAMVTVASPSGAALEASGPGVTVTLQGVRLTGNGAGLIVRNGAELQARRVSVDAAGTVGVTVSNPATIVALEEMVVADCEGRGVSVQWGAEVSLASIRLRNNLEYGLVAASDLEIKPGDVLVIEQTPASWTRTLIARILQFQVNFGINPIR